MPTTPKRFYPYPTNSVAPDVPLDLKALADAVDADMEKSAGLRPALAAGTDLDTVKIPGTYPVPTTVIDTLINKPSWFNETGALIVVSNGHPTSPAVIHTLRGYGNVTATRAIGSVTSQTWTAWRRGDTGLTIDQTAGRVVKIWDYINGREQLIYGDTGIRDIATTWDPGSSGGQAYLRRSGNTVALNIYNVMMTGANSPYTLPSGFRPDHRRLFNSPLYPGGAGNRVIIYETGQVSVFGVAAGSSQNLPLMWQTSEPWPTTLPGTAVGSISA